MGVGVPCRRHGGLASVPEGGLIRLGRATLGFAQTRRIPVAYGPLTAITYNPSEPMLNEVLLRFAPICPDLLRFAPICSDLPRFAPICPDLPNGDRVFWRWRLEIGEFLLKMLE